MMRNRFAALCCVLLLLSLFGCGRMPEFSNYDGEDDGTYQTDATTDGTYTVTGSSTSSTTTKQDGPTTTRTTQPTIPECVHTWGQWVQTAAPTCLQAGVKERSCLACRATQSEAIAKTSHRESGWIVDRVAEVGVEGLKHTKCVYCDKRMAEQTIPAIAESHRHTVNEWSTTKAPTCTEPGTQNAVCSCGATVETKELPPSGHTAAVDKAVNAACTVNGLTEGSHCSVCGVILVEQTIVAATGHSMASKTVAATADKAEHTLHYCTRCSYRYEETHAPASPLQFQSNNNGTCRVVGLLDTSVETLVIPQKSPAGDTVTAIGDRAFIRNATLQSVTLPSTVKKLGEFAFYACPKLTAVNGSEHLTTIGISAFSDCTALTSLNLSKATTMADYVCSGATSLSSVTLSKRLTKLPQGTFARCEALLDITLPASLTAIGNSAFASTNIQSIVLPDSVEEIEMYAFRYCSKLETVKLPKNLKIIHPLVFERCSSLNNVTLPEGLKTLGRLAFADCKALTAINIPGTLTSVGDSCFSGCTGLRRATLSDKLTVIPMRLFSGCSALETVILPSGIVSIGQEAFSGTAITGLVIPNSCTSIGTSAFSGCQKLVSVSFGSQLKTIQGHAFYGCRSLTEVTLPATFETLGDCAFMNCSALEKLYLGTSITDIGSGAFTNCTALKTVFLPKSLSGIKPATYDQNPFTGCSGTLDLYSDASKTNYTWSRYFGLISYGVSYEEYLTLTQ